MGPMDSVASKSILSDKNLAVIQELIYGSIRVRRHHVQWLMEIVDTISMKLSYLFMFELVAVS